MSIDTLKFVEDATHHGFTKEQATFLAQETNIIHKEKVGNEYLDHLFNDFEKSVDLKLRILSNEILVKFGGVMIVWTTISLAILGFIIKH